MYIHVISFTSPLFIQCSISLCGRLLLECDGTRAEKPDFFFAAKLTGPFKSVGVRQFSPLLSVEVWASAVVMLDTACSEVVWRVLATHCIRQFTSSFPLQCVTMCHHVSTALYSCQLPIPLPSPHSTNPALQHSHSILPNTYCLCLTIK